jgi:hypothetical protein
MTMRLLIVGGSDAGISAALCAHELDPNAEITVLLADDFPNYSICGLPFYLSGETPNWQSLAHRTQFDGITVYRGREATHIDIIFASALFHGMAVEEMGDLDLSYTPPLSSPWDPVQMAAHHWAAALRSEQMEATCRK